MKKEIAHNFFSCICFGLLLLFLWIYDVHKLPQNQHQQTIKGKEVLLRIHCQHPSPHPSKRKRSYIWYWYLFISLGMTINFDRWSHCIELRTKGPLYMYALRSTHWRFLLPFFLAAPVNGKKKKKKQICKQVRACMALPQKCPYNLTEGSRKRQTKREETGRVRKSQSIHQPTKMNQKKQGGKEGIGER